MTTLHGRLDIPNLASVYQHFADAPVVSISNAQRKPLPFANWAATVHHGLPSDLLPFNAEGGRSMCGHDWCAVRISQEIARFAGGKAAGFERGPARSSPALTADQGAILTARGEIDPDRIHELAAKTRRAVSAGRGPKPACHSDVAGSDAARSVQRQLAREAPTSLESALADILLGPTIR